MTFPHWPRTIAEKDFSNGMTTTHGIVFVNSDNSLTRISPASIWVLRRFPGANRAKRGTTVAPILRHGEKLTARFSEIAYGMTPMTESLWWVMRQMCLLHESRKIILIITDGKPDSIPAAQEVFKQAQKNGYGLRNKRNHAGIKLNELR